MSRRSDILTPERCDVECLHPDDVRPLLGRVLDTRAGVVVGDTFAVLADPTRVRILHALSLAKELCVCDLALLVGASQSAMSHQLRLLRLNRVVERRKQGRVMYYRLADDHVRRILRDAVRHAAEESDSDLGDSA